MDPYRDKKMLVKNDGYSRMRTSLSGWEPHVVAYHPELEDQFRAIKETKQWGNLLFPLEQVKWCQHPSSNDGPIYKVDWFGRFRLQVFNEALGLEINTHDEVTKLLKRVLPNEYSESNRKVALSFEIVDQSLVWPPMTSLVRHQRPWVAVRHFAGLSVEKPCSCGECMKSIATYTATRLVIAAWGIGKNCNGTGYVVALILNKETEAPYPIY